jgi:protein-tyrosine phosphatase
MDTQNYCDILSLDRQDKYRHKVRLMCDFATNSQQREVPDPYYGGRDGFDRVIELLLDACNGLLEKVVVEIGNQVD